jgi:hypothetical protein
VFPLVLAHVNELAGFFDGEKGGFDDGGWCTDKGYDGAIGGFAGVDIQKSDAGYGFDLIGDLFDNGRGAAFAEVWYTLYYLLHMGKRGIGLPRRQVKE